MYICANTFDTCEGLKGYPIEFRQIRFRATIAESVHTEYFLSHRNKDPLLALYLYILRTVEVPILAL